MHYIAKYIIREANGHCSDTAEYANNLRFFVKNGIHEGDNCDYVIVIQQVPRSSALHTAAQIIISRVTNVVEIKLNSTLNAYVCVCKIMQEENRRQ